MITDDEGLVILGEDECRELLEASWLGRIAVTMGAVPAIFPVNYIYSDDAIYFRTSKGVKFEAAVSGTVVAFEVDEADVSRAEGWSVLAVGNSSVVTDPEEVARVNRLPFSTWAPGARTKVIRIDPVFVSGRRITHNGHTPLT